jgi:hypothetical protein
MINLQEKGKNIMSMTDRDWYRENEGSQPNKSPFTEHNRKVSEAADGR